jgi:D-glycero-D-manno-heptose 1,7-bisphosphate phosphatase
MDKVIFLDRDGTINKEVEYLHRPEDLVILPGVASALRQLKEHGFQLVIVTNQAGVARGYYTEEDVKVLHTYLNTLLENEHATIDHFFYCPHHPVHGIGSYKKNCHCRKPEIGMLEMAEEYYQIDKHHSYMIGDKLLDTEAGHNYGIKSILVGTGYGKELLEEIPQNKEHKYFNYFAENLQQAADWILKEEGDIK